MTLIAKYKYVKQADTKTNKRQVDKFYNSTIILSGAFILLYTVFL